MTVNIIVMVLYFMLTIGIGLYFGKKKTGSSADFTVGGRRMSGPLMFFTMLATIVGASTVMGAASWFSRIGVSRLWFFVGITLTNLLFVFYLGPKINAFGREQGGETVGDWFEYRYGKVSKYLASLLIALAYIAITAFQYLAMATILEIATGIPFAWGLAITTIIVIVYTAVGGLWAVVSTDVLQGVMTLLGVIIMVPVFFTTAGGFSAVIAALPETHLQAFGNVTPWNAFAAMLTFGLGIVCWPDIWQRMYAAKDIPTLKKSYGLYIGAYIVVISSVMCIGFASKVLLPSYEGAANAMLPTMILQYLPNVLGAVLLSALIAVIMGTADSVLLVSAIIIEKDLVTPFLKPGKTDKQKLVLTKIITVLTGLAVLIVLYFSRNMFTLWVMSADITGATLAVPILLGFAWKKPNEAAAIASIFFGFAGWLLITLKPELIPVSPILPGAVLSLTAYVVTALIAPARSR
ncbi:MAG: sodium:solute symporter family protein [Spirochaetaceae bacterium]|nr:sodium:solute symporter family protein [Spirochaetaceae bacterium]